MFFVLGIKSIWDLGRFIYMLTIATALLYARTHKVLENRLIYGKKEKNVSNIFLISSGKAKRQLRGHMISKFVSDKFILCGAIAVDCLLVGWIFST
jgi:hypothetical protein